MRLKLRLLFVSTLIGAAIATSAVKAHGAEAGGDEPAIKVEGAQGAYLRAMHARMHARWNDSFVKTVAATYPANHPLNDRSRKATVGLTIRWDGSIAEAKVKQSSGSPDFDRAAVDVARKSAPYPLPTTDVLSDDGYAHVDWMFARDNRGCAAGPSVSRIEDPLDVSLPRLISQHRLGEALRRVGDAVHAEGDAPMDRFARLYLGTRFPDADLDVAASAALAHAGDRKQEARLRGALAKRSTAPVAAVGLYKLGVDVCGAVRPALEHGDVETRAASLEALRAVIAKGGSVAPCADALSALLSDSTATPTSRLGALDMLQAQAPASVRPVVMTLLEDKDLSVRGAAIFASVRKGAGRPEMYRLAPMLHDKSVEVRAAASAGIVRAAGDLALDQLYLLARERDPRPAVGVAAELAHLSSAASAEFLAKMLKRNNPTIQMAAVTALAARRDSASRAALQELAADPDTAPELRDVATGKAKGPVVAAAAVSPTKPVVDLLQAHKSREAVGWMVDRLPALSPKDTIDALGSWLVRPAPAAADSSTNNRDEPTPAARATTSALTL